MIVTTQVADLEIGSRSPGGGRVDLEVLRHTDRAWASDCIDALGRRRVQRWTGRLLPPELVDPPELVGSHVGAPTAHTTHRTHAPMDRVRAAIDVRYPDE